MRESTVAVRPCRGVWQRRDSRRPLGAGRALRQLIAAGGGADDVGLDHDVGRAADHQEMLDIVAPDQHQPAAAIHGGRVDDGEPRHPSAVGVGAEAVARESAHQPGGEADQAKDHHEREDEGQCSRHALSPPNSALPGPGARPRRSAEWRFMPEIATIS